MDERLKDRCPSLDPLCREKIGANKWWRYSLQADVQNVPVQPEQILDIEVNRDWKFDSRINRFL